MKESVITKDTNATVDEVWNVHTKHTLTHLGVGKNSIRKKEGAVIRRKNEISQGSLQGRKNKHSKKTMRGNCEYDVVKC